MSNAADDLLEAIEAEAFILADETLSEFAAHYQQNVPRSGTASPLDFDTPLANALEIDANVSGTRVSVTVGIDDAAAPHARILNDPPTGRIYAKGSPNHPENNGRRHSGGAQAMGFVPSDRNAAASQRSRDVAKAQNGGRATYGHRRASSLRDVIYRDSVKPTTEHAGWIDDVMGELPRIAERKIRGSRASQLGTLDKIKLAGAQAKRSLNEAQR